MLSSFSYSLTVQVKDKQLSFKLTKEECQKLTVEHQPSDDVSYKPDRDVKGKPVKPATIEENK
ncbi:MAG: hypothetical protein HYS39_03010, partial [Proteobacteria bacterium]|nr:hypothetical protein [Pseudomonadota bacterium]